MSTQEELEQYVLGHEASWQGHPALVVRHVRSESVMELPDGSWLYLEERYVELKLSDGTPEFVELWSATRPIEKKSSLKPLNAQVWRPK